MKLHQQMAARCSRSTLVSSREAFRKAKTNRPHGLAFGKFQEANLNLSVCAGCARKSGYLPSLVGSRCHLRTSPLAHIARNERSEIARFQLSTKSKEGNTACLFLRPDRKREIKRLDTSVAGRSNQYDAEPSPVAGPLALFLDATSSFSRSKI